MNLCLNLLWNFEKKYAWNATWTILKKSKIWEKWHYNRAWERKARRKRNREHSRRSCRKVRGKANFLLPWDSLFLYLFSSIFEFIYLFIYYVYSIWPTCMAAGQKREPDLIVGGYEPTYSCWELNAQNLEEQSVLWTSELSL